MEANVTQFEDEAPTRPINDGPTLIRIRRLATVAIERLAVAPDEDAVAAAAQDLTQIAFLATEALR